MMSYTHLDVNDKKIALGELPALRRTPKNSCESKKDKINGAEPDSASERSKMCANCA